MGAIEKNREREVWYNNESNEFVILELLDSQSLLAIFWVETLLPFKKSIGEIHPLSIPVNLFLKQFEYIAKL